MYFGGLALLAKGHVAGPQFFALSLLLFTLATYAGVLIAKVNEGAEELIWLLFRPFRLMWPDRLDPWFFWLLLTDLVAIPCLFWLAANLPPGARLWPW